MTKTKTKRVPSRQEIIARRTVELATFGSLPRSAGVDPYTICAHLQIGYATFWRMVKDGRLPPVHYVGRSARVNVGQYLDIIEVKA